MRTLAAFAYLASACTIPDAEFDSLTCPGGAAPMVPATVTISGNLIDPYMNASVANAMINVIRGSDGSDLDIATTDGSGHFSFDISTSIQEQPPAPLAAHLEIFGSAASDDPDPPVPISYWPAGSIGSDLLNIKLQIYTYGELAMIDDQVGTTLGSDTVQVFVSVVDCVDGGVSGATIETGGTVTYIDDNDSFDQKATSTSALGVGLVIGQGSDPNVSVGATTVHDGTQFMFDRHVVVVPPGTVGEAEVGP